MSKNKLIRLRPEHHMAAKQMYKAGVVPSKKVYKRKPKHKSRGETNASELNKQNE